MCIYIYMLTIPGSNWCTFVQPAFMLSPAPVVLVGKTCPGKSHQAWFVCACVRINRFLHSPSFAMSCYKLDISQIRTDVHFTGVGSHCLHSETHRRVAMMRRVHATGHETISQANPYFPPTRAPLSMGCRKPEKKIKQQHVRGKYVLSKNHPRV